MEPFFERGIKAEIIEAKKEYRRMYKAAWRKAHRKAHKEITTAWDKPEYDELKIESKKHRLSITRFIKKATQGYIDQRYIPLHQEETQKIIQLLALTLNQIDELCEDGKISNQVSILIEEKVSRLEQDIRITLYSPKTIWHICAEWLREKPKIKSQLISFIENQGHDH